MISVVQLVDTVHAVEDSLRIINELSSKGLKEEDNAVKPRAGMGIGAVEASQDIFFHDYTFDKNVVLTSVNCIIPTNQNHNNIQKDMEALVPSILTRPEKEIRHILEMLVRAYDPCISCSSHLLKVSFKK